MAVKHSFDAPIKAAVTLGAKPDRAKKRFIRRILFCKARGRAATLTKFQGSTSEDEDRLKIALPDLFLQIVKRCLLAVKIKL